MTVDRRTELTLLLAQAEERFPPVEASVGWLHWRREHLRWAFYVCDDSKYVLLRDAPTSKRVDAAEMLPQLYRNAQLAAAAQRAEVGKACNSLHQFLTDHPKAEG